MNYEFDVFISYRRHTEWNDWVRNKFKRLLDTHLSNELGREAKIFTDDTMESGSDWPLRLSRALTFSSIVVPLFSRMYFSSKWCLREYSAARFKEDRFGFRTSTHPSGIIVPGLIHDGVQEELPQHLHECCRIQARDLKKFALVHICSGSKKFQLFEEAIRDWVVTSIKPAIEKARECSPDEAWVTKFSLDDFDSLPPADFDNPFPSLAS